MTPAASVPDLSVIVIGHDVREEALACIESLHRHRGHLALEVLYIDNGSVDGSADAVAGAFDDVQVVRLDRNEGVPARNHGLRRARGRHRMFLDSDAQVTPGALQTVVGILDADPRIGLVGPRLVYPDGRPQPSARRFPPPLLPLLRRPPLDRWFADSPAVRHHLMADARLDQRRRVEYVLGACQVFSATAQAAAGEIDRRIFYGPDDADWCFAIREAGFDVVYAPEATIVHDYRRSSAARPVSRLALRHLRTFAYFQWKWRARRRNLIAEGRAMDRDAEQAPAVRT
jgi:GT2 family glycosyltransferase